MKGVWTWIKNNPIRFMFLIPIILVAIISISHVVSWYDLANPFSWAIYLSIAIEIGAMTALVAVTNRIKGGVWLMFGLVTFIQMVGNIFFSYKEVDTTGYLFKSWIELTAPVWEVLGSDSTDLVAMKRWIAFLEGGLLPIISLTSLHFFVKFDDGKPKIEQVINDQITDSVTQVIEEDVEGTLSPESVTNPTYEITKEIYENNVEPIDVDVVTGEIKLSEEQLPIPTEVYLTETTTLPIVETFVSEEEYLDLQESRSSVNEPETEVVNDTVNEPVNDTVNEPETEVVNDTVNEPETEGVNEGVNEGVKVDEETGEINLVYDTPIIEDDYILISKSEEPTIETTDNLVSEEESTDTEENNVRRLSYVKKS